MEPKTGTTGTMDTPLNRGASVMHKRSTEACASRKHISLNTVACLEVHGSGVPVSVDGEFSYKYGVAVICLATLPYKPHEYELHVTFASSRSSR